MNPGVREKQQMAILPIGKMYLPSSEEDQSKGQMQNNDSVQKTLGNKGYLNVKKAQFECNQKNLF